MTFPTGPVDVDVSLYVDLDCPYGDFTATDPLRLISHIQKEHPEEWAKRLAETIAYQEAVKEEAARRRAERQGEEEVVRVEEEEERVREDANILFVAGYELNLSEMREAMLAYPLVVQEQMEQLLTSLIASVAAMEDGIGIFSEEQQRKLQLVAIDRLVELFNTLDWQAIAEEKERKEAKDEVDEEVEEQDNIFTQALRGIGELIPEALAWGLEVFFDVLGKAAAPALRPLLNTMEATGKVPAELQPFLDELRDPTGEVGALFAQSAGNALIGGAVGKIIDSILLPLAYDMAAIGRPQLLGMGEYLDLWIRKVITLEELVQYLSWLGIGYREQEHLMELTQIRLDPSAVTQLWLRGFPTEEASEVWFDDLRNQGWGEQRIRALKELAHYMPSPTEVMTWAAREVFEPALRDRFQLDLDRPEEYEQWAKKVGITDDVMRNAWAAHWELPSLTSIIELWRRQELTDEEVDVFWKELDMVPWIREKLFKLFKVMPTRVDLRRWWDMASINEEELIYYYKALGYWGDELDRYVQWTKVYVDFPDLIARFKNGWISPEKVKEELLALGMPEDRAVVLIETKFKKAKPERTVKERNLTQAQIYKGVKKEVISWGYGLELLQQLGYDAVEADYILTINVPVEDKVTEVKRRELSKTDILNGLKTEIIKEGEALSRLMLLRYTGDDAAFILDVFKAAVKPPTEVREREASKADILEGVKKGLLTAKEGYLMLQDVGFSAEASEFILAVRAEESPFSPTTPSEFQQLMESYRGAQGMERKEIAQEVIDAERALATIEAQLGQAHATNADISDIDNLETARVEAQVKLRELYILHEPTPEL